MSVWSSSKYAESPSSPLSFPFPWGGGVPSYGIPSLRAHTAHPSWYTPRWLHWEAQGGSKQSRPLPGFGTKTHEDQSGFQGRGSGRRVKEEKAERLSEKKGIGPIAFRGRTLSIRWSPRRIWPRDWTLGLLKRLCWGENGSW